MSMPNVSSGVTTQILSAIINTFDIYVQYAICEGFGMPQVEAAACGIPVAAVDYSAMNDVVHKLNGYPIKVNQAFKELETKAVRVYPDNAHLVKILYDYLNLPEILKVQKRAETRKLTEQYYNWDLIAKKWENYFDNIQLKGLQGKWDENLPALSKIENIPDNATSYYDVITEIVSNNMPNHQVSSSIILLNMIRDLDYGFAINGMSTEPYNMSKALDILNNMIVNNNIAQNAKDNNYNLKNEDFIEYANMKAKLQ
jgi:hypothetical protein